MMHSQIRLQRVYDPIPLSNIYCYLVDRLWPRGITKQRLQGIIWLKDIAPSHELRRWYHANSDQWQLFYHKYWQELEKKPVVSTLITLLKRRKTIMLLYSSPDHEHNHAIILRDFLLNKLNNQ
ncbi:DUF488 family protein [Frischella sp. Ac48]|nr:MULTISPECIES: DUF488 family protein [Frischella]MBX4132322.1 DUF488 family protein [Frischella sp. Ac48]